MIDSAAVTAGNQNQFETWSAFNALSATKNVSKNNRGVVAPLIRSPPASPQHCIPFMLSTEAQRSSGRDT